MPGFALRSADFAEIAPDKSRGSPLKAKGKSPAAARLGSRRAIIGSIRFKGGGRRSALGSQRARCPFPRKCTCGGRGKLRGWESLAIAFAQVRSLIHYQLRLCQVFPRKWTCGGTGTGPINAMRQPGLVPTSNPALWVRGSQRGRRGASLERFLRSRLSEREAPPRPL